MLEVLRLCLLAILLCVASYHDIRTREIPDYLWILGGGIGLALYIFDWHEVDNLVVFSIMSGMLVSVLAWKLFPMGQADILAILSSCAICPISFGVMVPVVLFVGGLILEHIYAIFYNMRYNLADLYNKRLYSGIDCPWHVKIMAFYSVHRKRPHERFVFCAEKRSTETHTISFRTPSPDSEYESTTGIFVTWAMPAFPFMLAALVLASITAWLFW